MKFNLKNRPKLNEDLLMTTKLKDYWYRTEDWVDDFEKELREIQAKTQGKWDSNVPTSVYMFIKEILGE